MNQDTAPNSCRLPIMGKSPHRSRCQEACMSSSPSPPSKPPRILIADDDPQGVELLEAYLAGTDYEVRTAADGEETLRQLQEWRPDVVLLDVMMPKISGFQVCK